MLPDCLFKQLEIVAFSFFLGGGAQKTYALLFTIKPSKSPWE